MQYAHVSATALIAVGIYCFFGPAMRLGAKLVVVGAKACVSAGVALAIVSAATLALGLVE